MRLGQRGPDRRHPFGYGKALYQLRVVAGAWEPFFGDGSRAIFNSSVSRILQIPDAARGVCGYLLDAVAVAIGGRACGRTLLWMVHGFGLAVGPLGAVSILLVILRPMLFNAWCTLCFVVGGLLLGLVTIRGPLRQRFGGGWRSLVREAPGAARKSR